MSLLAGLRRRRVCRLGPSRLAVDDLAKVVGREPDPAPVQVERHLPAICACAQCALGHLGEPELLEDLRCFGWGEEPGKVQPCGEAALQPAGWRRDGSARDLAAGCRGRSPAGRRKVRCLGNGPPSCPVGGPFPASWGWHVCSVRCGNLGSATSYLNKIAQGNSVWGSAQSALWAGFAFFALTTRKEPSGAAEPFADARATRRRATLYGRVPVRARYIAAGRSPPGLPFAC